MSPHSLSATNLLACVRAWFGLDQAALALYLAMSPGTVHSIEAGRRALTADLFLGLWPLLPHLPSAEAAAPPVAALPVAPAALPA